MPVSKTKAILFCRTSHAKVVRNRPVAAFNDARAAQNYAIALKNAHKAGDAKMVAALDPRYPFPSEGELIKDTKLSVTTVPYAPEVVTEDEGIETEDITQPPATPAEPAAQEPAPAA